MCDAVLIVCFPLNVWQLNNLAGGGQSGEKKEGESPKYAVATREAFVDVGHIPLQTVSTRVSVCTL